ncbi:MAG: hypothetical protein OEN56_05430 [Gemmatimonadota bacterium]|nr:hypothetical protein [Gemmatimonadota bacterium]
MMINVRMDSRRSAPAWAAVGAPLVGVPILVALLALATPAPDLPENGPDTVVRIEQIEALPVGAAGECEAALQDGVMKNG